MKTIYYLARSYPEVTDSGGGALIRKATVELLRKYNFNVIVVVPNYHSNILDINKQTKIIKIPCKINNKITYYLEKYGLIEDYLDKWVKKAFEYLLKIINVDDIIFATTGGELATLKLGSLLKNKINHKLIIHYHDPIDYTTYKGLMIENRFHVNRDKLEKKYIYNADLIITSSKTQETALKNKYPFLNTKIINNYFGYIGYINKMKLTGYKKKQTDFINIAYAGAFGKNQKPELLLTIYNLCKNKNKIRLYFIGNYKNHKNIYYKDTNITYIDFLPHEKFLQFMIEKIDIGFVSLYNDYLGLCIPSKIYEYINLGLPILGALPDGDAKELINREDFGIAKNYRNTQELAEILDNFTQNPNKLVKYKKNILKKRNEWSMENRIKEIISLIKNL